MRSVPLVAAIVVTGCLATACVQAASGAVATSSPGASAPATASAPPTPTPGPPSPTPTAASPSAPPTTAAPTPAGSSPASSTGSSSDLIWLWVVLGALVLLGIILWATRSPARSSAAANWRARAADAYAKGGALDGAVRAAERQDAIDGARWYDIDRRADDLTQTLYAMRETAPNEERRAQVADALASLQAVRHAVNAQRAPGGAGARPGGNLHPRLLALESSLNVLRVPEDGRLR
jgi:hypothetical protein